VVRLAFVTAVVPKLGGVLAETLGGAVMVPLEAGEVSWFTLSAGWFEAGHGADEHTYASTCVRKLDTMPDVVLGNAELTILSAT
jgi:hypothetical protein